MVHFNRNGVLLLMCIASGACGWWLGGIEYPDSPLTRALYTMVLVNSTATVVQKFDKQENQKSLEG